MPRDLTDLVTRVADSAARDTIIAAAAGMVVGVLLILLTRRRRSRPAHWWSDRLTSMCTIAAAAIATAYTATGMWRVTSDALGQDVPVAFRACLFAFLEIALLASALRAHKALRDTRTTGIDGAAVWVIASMSGVLSALDARSFLEVLLRIIVALTAAWLWERELAPTRRQWTERTRQNVAWRLTRGRVLVWLRLADPAETELGELARRRRISRLVRAAARVHRPPAGKWWTPAGRADVILRRRALATAAVDQFGADPGLSDAARVQAQLATFYAVRDATDPSSVAALSGWTTTRPAPPESSETSVPELEGAESDGSEPLPLPPAPPAPPPAPPTERSPLPPPAPTDRWATAPVEGETIDERNERVYRSYAGVRQESGREPSESTLVDWLAVSLAQAKRIRQSTFRTRFEVEQMLLGAPTTDRPTT